MSVDLSFLPSEMKRILLDFTLSCLIENPRDFVIYGCEYFEKIIRRRTENIRRLEAEKLVESKRIANIVSLSRRNSILAEIYYPEDVSSIEEMSPIFKTPEERKKLLKAVKHVFLLRNLDADDLEHILDRMEKRDVVAGEVIIEQGSLETDSFYIVQEGDFEVSVTLDYGEKNVVRSYSNKGSFGELALMYKTPRTATVQALTDGKLWVLDRISFQRIVLKSSFLKRKRYCSLIEKVDIISNLSDYERLDLADALIPKVYSDNDIIFNEGDKGNGMYFIESGRVKCSKMVRGSSVNISVLKRNQYFGELDLLTNNRRSFTVCALGVTKLAFLDKEAFVRLLGPLTELLKRNMKKYEENLSKGL